MLFSDKDYLIYKFIDGDFIVDYIKKFNKNQIKKIIKTIFNQLHTLDKLKIDKEEMHRPLKHIIISDNKPYLIDFERTHYVRNPKNVTQFCQFLISGNFTNILRNKDIYIDKNEAIKLAKIYKKNQSFANFKKIMNML